MTPWTVVSCQAPLSMGFSRQEYWSGLPFPSPGDLPDPGIEPMSLTLAGGFFTPGKPLKQVECGNWVWEMIRLGVKDDSKTLNPFAQ